MAPKSHPYHKTDEPGDPSAMASPTSVSALVHEESETVEPLVLSPSVDSSTSFGWTILTASQKSQRTTNPIRNIVDPIFSSIQEGSERVDRKDPISLALGDPTAAGNLPPCPTALKAVSEALREAPHAAGYVPACGCPRARQAVADFHARQCQVAGSSKDANERPNLLISSDQVIVASGCSGALELALTALLEEDSILLVPQPGFPLYAVIAESHGASTLSYRLDARRNWEVDLGHLNSILREHAPSLRIRGMVLNNPSNPTGAVYERQHLRDVVALCQRYRIPIVADEVYGDLVFGGDADFVPVAQVAFEMGHVVPVITASGIGKQFLLPGWRVGWVVFHDNIYGSLRQVELGAKRLAQVILGASHLPQTALPALLNPKDPMVADWKHALRCTLEGQAALLCQALRNAPGLHVLHPQGAMYAMIRVDTAVLRVQDDIDLAQRLLEEENVIVLPGACFGMPHYIRAVFCAPPAILEEAARRIVMFCDRHSAPINTTTSEN